MFTRITKAGDHQYLQLVESFRNDSGKVRTRVVANLGRLDQIVRALAACTSAVCLPVGCGPGGGRSSVAACTHAKAEPDKASCASEIRHNPVVGFVPLLG